MAQGGYANIWLAEWRHGHGTEIVSAAVNHLCIQASYFPLRKVAVKALCVHVDDDDTKRKIERVSRAGHKESREAFSLYLLSSILRAAFA